MPNSRTECAESRSATHYHSKLHASLIIYLRILTFVWFASQIPLPPVDERKKVVEDVDKDRRYAIDAAIVRIMKSRKVLGHQQLVSECVEQLSRMFKVIYMF